MKSKKLVIGIFIFIVLSLGVTTALYKWSASLDTNINVNLNGYDTYVDYVKGTDTLDDDLAFTDSYTEGLHSSVTIGKNSNATNIPLYGHIYLDINEIGSNISSDHGLKWVLTSGSSSNIVASGDFYGTLTSSHKLIYSNFELTNPSVEYTLWLYLLESDIINQDIALETLDFDIRIEVTGKSV